MFYSKIIRFCYNIALNEIYLYCSSADSSFSGELLNLCGNKRFLKTALSLLASSVKVNFYVLSTSETGFNQERVNIQNKQFVSFLKEYNVVGQI